MVRKKDVRLMCVLATLLCGDGGQWSEDAANFYFILRVVLTVRKGAQKGTGQPFSYDSVRQLVLLLVLAMVLVW